jgi:hypothetical protein
MGGILSNTMNEWATEARKRTWNWSIGGVASGTSTASPSVTGWTGGMPDSAAKP